MKGIFITGTDTGVGKTYVATGIIKELRRRTVNVGILKPAETGCKMRNGRLNPADAMQLMKAADVHDSLSLVNPYCYRKPLAPLVAAKLEKGKINPSKILTAFNTLVLKHEFMVVEGAGGIMVPLREDYLYLDLANDLKLPIVIVARPSLGTINHTLLTIEAIKRRRLKLAGIIINYASNQKKELAEKTSPQIISAISHTKIIGIISHGSKKFSHIVDCLG